MNLSSESFMSMPMFSVPEAAAVSGIPQNTISTWIKRGYMPGAQNLAGAAQDLGGGVQGKARFLTGRTVIAFAIMHQFAELGATPQEAAIAAVHFAHMGTASAKWEGEEFFEDDEPDRDPGEPFEEGWTLISLVPAHRSKDGQVHVEVLSSTWLLKEPSNIFYRLLQADRCLNLRPGAIILDATMLVHALQVQLSDIAKQKKLVLQGNQLSQKFSNLR